MPKNVPSDECMKSLRLQKLGGDYWDNGEMQWSVTLGRPWNDNCQIVLIGDVRIVAG